MTSSSTFLTLTAKTKYHFASFPADCILSRGEWMTKASSQASQRRSTAGGIIIVSSTTEEELTSPEKYTIKSGSESDPPLMVSLVPSSERCCKPWKLSPSEKTSSVESSDATVMDEDHIIAETSSSESGGSSQLEALIEKRMDESEDTDEFKGIETRWKKDGEDISSTDSEDDGEISGPVQRQLSETHQKKTAFGTANEDRLEDTGEEDAEEIVLPILNPPSRRLSQTTSVNCPRTVCFSRKGFENSELRSSQKDQERHPPKNLRKRPREALTRNKNRPYLGGGRNNAEDSIESCSSDDDCVDPKHKNVHGSQLELSRTLQEKSHKNKVISTSNLTSLSVTNDRIEEGFEGSGMGTKVREAFLAGCGTVQSRHALFKAQTNRCQSVLNPTRLSADADESRNLENNPNKCGNEKNLTMMADTQEYVATKILCFPVSVEHGPTDIRKVSRSSSCESKNSASTLEPDTVSGLEASQHSQSEFDDMTQPYCDSEEDAACPLPLADQVASEFRNNRPQGPASNKQVGQKLGASSGTGVALSGISDLNGHRSDPSNKGCAVAEEYSDQDESQQSQLLFDSEEETYEDHNIEASTLSSQPKHPTARVSERLATGTKEIEVLLPVFETESKDVKVLGTFESGKSDTRSVTVMCGDNKSKVSYSTDLTSEDDDAIMVFDSEEEELYSRFTQVEVKKESLTDEDEKRNVISSEEDSRTKLIGGGDGEEYDSLCGDVCQPKKVRAYSISPKGRTLSTDDSSVYDQQTLADEDVDTAGDNSIYDQQTLADEDVDTAGDNSIYDQQTLVDDYSNGNDDEDAYAAETQVEVDLLHGVHDYEVARMSSSKGSAGGVRSDSSKRHGIAPVECAQLKAPENTCKQVQQRSRDKSAENRNSAVEENALDKSGEDRSYAANKTLVCGVQTLVDDCTDDGGGDDGDDKDVYFAETQIDVDLLHGLCESNLPSSAARRASAEGAAGCAYSESPNSKTDATLSPKSAQRADKAASDKQVQEKDRKSSTEDGTCTTSEASIFDQQTLVDDYLYSDVSDEDMYLAETQTEVDSMYHSDNSNMKKTLTMKMSSESNGVRARDHRNSAENVTCTPSEASIFDQQTLVDDYLYSDISNEDAYLAETQSEFDSVHHSDKSNLKKSLTMQVSSESNGSLTHAGSSREQTLVLKQKSQEWLTKAKEKTVSDRLKQALSGIPGTLVKRKEDTPVNSSTPRLSSESADVSHAVCSVEGDGEKELSKGIFVCDVQTSRDTQQVDASKIQPASVDISKNCLVPTADSPALGQTAFKNIFDTFTNSLEWVATDSASGKDASAFVDQIMADAAGVADVANDLSDKEMNSEDDTDLFAAATQIDTCLAQDQGFLMPLHREPFQPSSTHEDNTLKHPPGEYENTNPDSGQILIMEETDEGCKDEIIIIDEIYASDIDEDQDAYSLATQVDVGPRRATLLGNESSEERREKIWKETENVQNQKDVEGTASVPFRSSSSEKSDAAWRTNGGQESKQAMETSDRSYETAVRKMEEIKKRAHTSRTQEIAIQPESRHRGHWRKIKQGAAEPEQPNAACAERKTSDADERWLSSASKSSFQEEKKSSDRVRKKKGPELPSKRLKRSSGSNEDISISTDAARKAMEARNKKVILDPSSVATHWRRPTSLTEETGMDTDVELPNTQEVMEKQYPILFPNNKIRKSEEKSRKSCSKTTQENENGEKISETSRKNSHSHTTSNERSRAHFHKNSSEEPGGRKTGSAPSNHITLSEKQKALKSPQKSLDSDKNQGSVLRKENVKNTIKDQSSLVKVGKVCSKRSSVSDFRCRDNSPRTSTSRNQFPHLQPVPKRSISMTSAQEGHFSKDDTLIACKSGPSTGRQRHTSQDSSLVNAISVGKPGILKDPHKMKETASTKSVRISLTDSQEQKFQARTSAKKTSSLAATSRPVPSSHSQMPSAGSFRISQSNMTYMSKRLPVAPSGMLGMTFRTSDVEGVSDAVSRTGQATPAQLLQSDELLCRVLGWSPHWLEEYEKSDNGTLNSLPPIVKRDKLFPLVTTYDNIFEYQQISLMLLLLEIWDEIFKNWKEKKARRLPVCNVCYTSNLRYTQKIFLGYEWKGFISKQQHEGRLHPVEGDLVVVEMYGESIDSNNHDPSKLEMRPQLGHVEKVAIQPCTRTQDVINKHPALQEHSLSTRRDACLITIMLKMRYRKFAPSSNRLVKLYSLGSIVTDVRRFEALMHLPRSQLVRDILKPTPSVFIHSQRFSSRPLFQNDSGKKYNEIQSQAIRNLATAVQEPPQVPRVRLLQGPPGTGKSHVIIGLILKILEDSSDEAKICLAAPSNAAADELLVRLSKKKKDDGLNFSMVRIGTVENVRAEVRAFTLESMIQKEKAKALKTKQLQNIPRSLQAEFERYEKLIDQKTSQIFDCITRKAKQEEEKLAKQLKDLKKKHADLQKIIDNGQKDVSLTYAEHHTIYRDMLLQANIVCGTLSSFGSSRIYNIFRDNGNSSNIRHFSCAIIDEATQATELDSLIPLQYGITKLILVGDPNQLPPTILSLKAQTLNYGLSLFERLYNHFQEDCEKENPLLMLRVQYRMDKAICQFPSNHVYDGQLLTGSQIIENCKRFPLQPYLIFDLAEGQEQMSQSGSLSNEAEADFTAELCSQILKLGFTIQPSNMGIICPYSSQKKLVLQKLDVRGVKQVEVNTVDGFQGREKHIIILSCVRAQSTSGSIGFMADRRRMNVALTRAKYALYIIGHLQSLVANQDWEALIRDAESEERKAVVSVASLTNLQAMVRQHCVKSEFQSKIKVA